jgi:hypothetical protein
MQSVRLFRFTVRIRHNIEKEFSTKKLKIM